MKVNGSCHCGVIAYEAEVDPARIGLCNCTDCQVFSGSAFRISAPAVAGTLRVKRGTPSIYVKTADSGRRRRQAFCATCGTPVYASDDADDATAFTLRVGCLEQRALLTPRRRIWCASALPWVESISEIPADDVSVSSP